MDSTKQTQDTHPFGYVNPINQKGDQASWLIAGLKNDLSQHRMWGQRRSKNFAAKNHEHLPRKYRELNIPTNQFDRHLPNLGQCSPKNFAQQQRPLNGQLKSNLGQQALHWPNIGQCRPKNFVKESQIFVIQGLPGPTGPAMANLGPALANVGQHRSNFLL